MEDRFGSPSARNYRFYIVVDVSWSMNDAARHGVPTPYERLQAAVPSLAMRLRREPSLRGRTYVAVMTFSAEADVLLPSVLVDDFTGHDDLVLGTVTDYSAAFTRLDQLVAADDAELPLQQDRVWYRPAVFFLTDGVPQTAEKLISPEEWKPARDRFVDRHDANIVALGFGDVPEDVLQLVATGEGDSCLAFIDEGTLTAGDLIESIKTALLRSIMRSATSGIFDCPLPRGMRKVLPPPVHTAHEAAPPGEKRLA